ncbi:MAG: 5-methyltetrahydropteroyltriglutamate--homocysteine S-methyltransferase [Candidatus Latescibacteria bacterium]|jgi:5-methyltetrahydropteroyltriglutamate--homocysteine methyltransferase|nr:5-methyltetrahydropteroyltriglutamate--homocysteine S-methyltransferase [Candidatus Latescibacterota bacterium]
MARRNKPPFRADHVGSLLRPEALKQAREALLGVQTADQNIGPHDNAELRKVEDRCIRDVIAMQKRVGLQSATDGEFRRRSWWLELIMTWEGFSATREGASSPFGWRNEQGKQQDFSTLWVQGKIRWRPSAVVRAFEFLKANTETVPKVTIPAPQVAHCFIGGDRVILESCYDDMDEFWEDLVTAYRQELAALVQAGARYIQLDDVGIPFICDPSYTDVFRSWGSSPEALLAEYARRINQVLEGLPPGVTVTMHQCRGNREGLWAAEGGYDPVADVLFNQINVHGYFLEYDTARAGSFSPLRFVPAGKVVALGLVSSKTQALESADALKRRIKEASRYAPLERLALAPQCGFASSIKGNPLTQVDLEAKLTRIVEVAADMWGDG